MPSQPGFSASVTERLQHVTSELREIENMLIHEKLESAVLTDFRDAVNRVRTTAWAVQQYLDVHEGKDQSASVLTLLANERIRVAYRLCRLIDGDLANNELQGGPLVQLYLASHDLAQRLRDMIGRDSAPHVSSAHPTERVAG